MVYTHILVTQFKFSIQSAPVQVAEISGRFGNAPNVKRGTDTEVETENCP